MSGRQRHHFPAEVSFPPLPERYQHGNVIRLPKSLADDEGRISRPYRSLDILDSLEARSKIDGPTRQAGEDFRELFRQAHLDPLQAQNPAHIYVENANRPLPAWGIEVARLKV